MDMMAGCCGGGMGGMRWGIGLLGLLVLILLVLAAAALVKYLLSGRGPGGRAPAASGLPGAGPREPGSRSNERPGDRPGHAPQHGHRGR